MNSFDVYHPAKHSYQGSTIPFNPEQCAANVHENSRFHGRYQCKRKPILQEEGYGWCKLHAPSIKEAKRVAEHAQWKYENDCRRWRNELRDLEYQTFRVALDEVVPLIEDRPEEYQEPEFTKLVALCQHYTDRQHSPPKEV